MLNERWGIHFASLKVDKEIVRLVKEIYLEYH
jgi:hypothetical protein